MQQVLGTKIPNKAPQKMLFRAASAWGTRYLQDAAKQQTYASKANWDQ